MRVGAAVYISKMGNRTSTKASGWKSRKERAAWRTQVKMRDCIKICVTEDEFENVSWNFVAECIEKCRDFANKLFNL
jgi:hypothetical protein